MFRAILSTAQKDLWRLRRDRGSLLIWVGVPLVIGGLLMSMAGGTSTSPPKAHLFIADQDKSFLSELLLKAADGAPVIEAEAVEVEQGRKRIGAGDGSALLIIPEGFGEALLEEKATEVQLITNPAQRILPGIIEESLSILVDATFYVHRIFGDDIRKVLDQASAAGEMPADRDVASVAVSVNQAMQRLGKYLLPPVLAVETTIEEEQRAKENSGAVLEVDLRMLFVPGVLLMSLMFMAQGLADDLWAEKNAGTLRRSMILPHSIRSILAGKLLANAVLIACVSLAILGLGMIYTGLPLSNLPTAVAWSTLAGSVFTVMMMLILVHLPSRRGGNLALSMLIFPLMMIGGSFFPFEAMPASMASIGRMTPNGWALTHLSDLLFDRSDLRALLLPGAVMSLALALLFFATSRRLAKFFAVE